MDPLSRKLFQNSPARERLSQMGGIMASSPALASTVARFQEGGPVGELEYVVIIPGVTDRRGMRVRASTLEMIGQANPDLLQRSQVMDSATAQSMGIDVPSVRPGDAILSRQLGPQPAAAPTPAPAPLGPDAMDLFSENFGVDDMPPPGPVPAPPPTPAEAIGLSPGLSIPVAIPEGEFGPSPERLRMHARVQETRDRRTQVLRDAAAEELRLSAARALADGQPELAAELEAQAAEFEQMPSEELLAGEPLPPENLEDVLPPPTGPEEPPAAGEEITPPARGGDEPPAAGGGETNDPLRAAETQLDQDLRTFFGIEPRDPSSRRAEFDERLSFFQEVLGTRSRDEARDRAMNLAMIGLAIAAGQSPNMLTNIAQGALAGTQAMQRAQAAGQEREDELRMLAFRDVLGDEQEYRQLRRALGMERFRDSIRPGETGESSRQELRYNEIYSKTYERVMQETDNVEEALSVAARAARAAAPLAPSARSAPSAGEGVSSAVAAQVQQDLQNNVPVATIRSRLVAAGLNPDDFEGLSE
jgi:hypothetical protein